MVGENIDLSMWWMHIALSLLPLYGGDGREKVRFLLECELVLLVLVKSSVGAGGGNIAIFWMNGLCTKCSKQILPTFIEGHHHHT